MYSSRLATLMAEVKAGDFCTLIRCGQQSTMMKDTRTEREAEKAREKESVVLHYMKIDQM